MDLFTILVGIFSLLLGFIGVFLTFVTFFAPNLVLKAAIHNPKRWQEVSAVQDGKKLFRHNIFSGYTIEVDFANPVVNSFYEYWMEALHRPDKTASTHHVTLFFNGLPLEQELFLLYDGSRNFIPVPLLSMNNKKRYVSFSQRQKQIANIVGYDYFDRDFDEVCSKIENSRFNPESLAEPKNLTKRQIEDLGQKIESFRARSSLARR